MSKDSSMCLGGDLGVESDQKKSMFSLEVLFGGICAFVPTVDGLGMHLIMLDKPGPQDPEIPPHRAVVRFSLSELNVSAADPLPATVGGVWKLDKRQLSIEFPGLPFGAKLPPLSIQGYDYKNNVLPVPVIGSAPDGHMGWVSRVEEACRKRNAVGAGRIDQDFLEPIETLNPDLANKMAGRMFLNTGEVEVRNWIQNDDGYVICRFKPFGKGGGANDHRQFVATRIALTVEVPTPTVKLVATRFSDKDVAALELRPELGNKVTISILNEESDSILDVSPEESPLIGVERRRDRIFESFVDLCPKAKYLKEKGLVPIPIPADVVPLAEGGGPLRSSAPCSPYLLDL